MTEEVKSGDVQPKFWQLPLIFTATLATELLICRFLVTRLPVQNEMPLPTSVENAQILSKTFQ